MGKDLSTLFKKFIDRKIEKVWTAMPCVVYTVYPLTMRCDLIMKHKDKDVIFNAPIAVIRGSNSAIIPPVKIGDVVLCVFSKYALSSLLVDKNVTSINIAPSFNSNDALIIVGIVVEDEADTTIIGSDTWKIVPDTLQIVSDSKILIHGDEVSLEGDTKLELKSPIPDLTFNDKISLPGASATYRGMIALIYGGVGVRDTLYICLKSDSDTYSWVAIADGGA